MLKISCTSEKALLLFARKFSNFLKVGTYIYLEGNLGAGKTTFARGVLQGYGYKGIVKSPTYTLVETYHIKNKCINHFDLYRVAHPEELEFIGIREYFTPEAICLIEWPNHGVSVIPAPSIRLQFSSFARGRIIEGIACTPLGEELLMSLKEDNV